MAKIFKNIMEEVALDLLDKTLETRTGICTCPECINDMMAHILSLVPAKYVTTDEQALKTLIDQTKLEKEAEVGRAVISALETVKKLPGHKKAQDKDEAFKLLLDKIYQDRGLDFHRYHQSILQRRVALRMSKNGIKTFSDYLMYLIKNPQEYDKLFEVLCINVTEFFRDPPVWDAAKDLFRDIIRSKAQQNDKTLVVWSAACATGEEPFSIGITLKNILKTEENTDIFVRIHATDIDPEALRACKKAEYGKNSLKNVSSLDLKNYFTPLENGNFKVNDEIKKMVNFGSLDLIAADFIRNTDIIFCRNVFIYFTRSLQDQLLMKFYNSLRSDGHLIIGMTETMWPEAREIFEEVNSKTHFYRKHTTV